jgi:eukaryotic-like serine/threonine-protein kinase
MPDQLRRLQEALAGRYHIERELGRGGMATVYLAEDVKHGRRVAIKVLNPELHAAVGAERFLREIGTAARLNHPHILPLHDSGEAAGFLFYVMPYVQEESLRDRLDREKQLPVDDALRIAGEIAEALDYAHRNGVVHRDVKPENILLGSGHALVADFGIARAIAAQGESRLTETGLGVGTPVYMSPEQASGDAAVDGRSDVYSLAAVLYEMLAGDPPYTGPTPQAVIARKASGELPSVATVRSVPPALDAVLRKALAPAPADRYSTAMAFVDAARDTASARVSRMPASVYRPRAAAVALLLAATAAAGWWWTRGEAAAAPDTVAVLPFVNVGGDPANQAFVDGMVEVLTSKLTQLERYFDRPLWVVPSSEIRSRSITSAENARREFGATLAVTGSVQQLGESLHLTLNLVNAATLRQVRSAVVEAPPTDLGVWQDGVVVRLADMLRLEMGPQARQAVATGGTSSAAAYELYVQGRGRLQEVHSGAAGEAAELFRRAIEHDDRYALAHAGLADAYWGTYARTGDTAWVSRAVASSQRALDLDDSLAPVWVTLGRIHLGMGLYDEAIRALDRALSMDPHNDEAVRMRARAYRGLGRHDDAEATLLRAIETRPHDWRPIRSLGVLYYELGRYEEAAHQMVLVTERNPLDPWSYVNAGGIYFFLENWVEARRLFERGIRIEPIAALYSNLGTLDFYEGRYAESARNFELALELEPDRYLYRKNLADALYWIPGERERALDTYRRAIELGEAAAAVNPNDAEVLASLSASYARLGERETAQAVLGRLLGVVGEDPYLMYDIAATYELLGDRDAALDWLGRALAAGYSRRVVESTPDLRALRADPRYGAIVPVP